MEGAQPDATGKEAGGDEGAVRGFSHQKAMLVAMDGHEQIADSGCPEPGTRAALTFMVRAARYLFACGSIFVIGGCGGPCGDPKVYTLRSTTMAYVGMFQENSYWIYQCLEDTSIMDTLTLHDRLQRIETLEPAGRNCKPNHAEELSYVLVGSVQTDTLQAWLVSRNSDAFSIGGTFLGNALQLDGDIDADTDWFVVSEYWNEELTFHEALEVGGQYYDDVVQIRDPYGYSFPDQVPTFWLARGVGIVQFEQYDELLGERRTFQLKEFFLQ